VTFVLDSVVYWRSSLSMEAAEGRPESEAMRFASAAAALKCTRFGGSVGSPTEEVEGLLMSGEARVSG
jgi:sulfofructose kinase